MMHPIIWVEVLHFNGSPPLRQKMKWPAECSLACPEHITYAEMHTHSIGIIVMHYWKRWHGYWGKQTHIIHLLHIFIIHTILKLSKSYFLFVFHAWIQKCFEKPCVQLNNITALNSLVLKVIKVTAYNISIYPMLSADCRFWLANNHEV